MATVEGYGVTAKHPARAGELLKAARIRAGWTQEKLAEEAKVSQPAISRIERGAQTPTEEHLTKFAWAFRIAPSELMPNHVPERQKKSDAGHAERKPQDAGADLDPRVRDSLADYLRRFGKLLGPEMIPRLWFRARGVDPDDEMLELNDELWDGIVNDIRAHYRNRKGS